MGNGGSASGLCSIKELFASFFDFINAGRIFSHFLPGLILAIAIFLLGFHLADYVNVNTPQPPGSKAQLRDGALRSIAAIDSLLTQEIAALNGSLHDPSALAGFNSSCAQLWQQQQALRQELQALEKPGRSIFAKDAVKLKEHAVWLLILALLCGIIISQTGYQIIRLFYDEDEAQEPSGRAAPGDEPRPCAQDSGWEQGLRSVPLLKYFFRVRTKYGRLRHKIKIPGRHASQVVKFIFYMPFLKTLTRQAVSGGVPQGEQTDYYDYLIREYYRFVEFNINTALALLFSAPFWFGYARASGIAAAAPYFNLLAAGALILLVLLLCAGAKNAYREWCDAQICLLEGAFRLNTLMPPDAPKGVPEQTDIDPRKAEQP